MIHRRLVHTSNGPLGIAAGGGGGGGEVTHPQITTHYSVIPRHNDPRWDGKRVELRTLYSN